MSDLNDSITRVTSRMTPDDASAVRTDFETVQEAGVHSVELLIEAVGDANRELPIRLIACSLLANLNETNGAPALARALAEGDDDGLVWEAAKALIRIRAENIAPMLVRVLKEGSPTKQSAAAYVLGWLGVPSTLPALRVAALDADLDDDVRGHSIEALGVMRAREVVSDLITLLSDVSPEVRYWAAYALGAIGDPVSIPALERMASSDVAILSRERSLKQEALDALELIRARREDAGTPPDGQ